MAKKTIIWSVILTMVVLTASIYFVFNNDTNNFKVDIQNTRTQYFVNESGWVLSATEYVNLYDGTSKMLAKSRNLTWYNDSGNVYVTRTSTWKDDITTIQIYTFGINEDQIENVPIKNELTCLNCKDKIVHYEIRDILYIGESKSITSPFSFGHKMNLEWEKTLDYMWAKVYQQKTNDKIVIRFKPDINYEVYNVRLFDPASDITVILNSPENNSFKKNDVTFNSTSSVTGGAILVNTSLYVNTTGSFVLNQTKNFINPALSSDFEDGAGYVYADATLKAPTGWSVGGGAGPGAGAGSYTTTPYAGTYSYVIKQNGNGGASTTAWINKTYGTGELDGTNITFYYMVEGTSSSTGINLTFSNSSGLANQNTVPYSSSWTLYNQAIPTGTTDILIRFTNTDNSIGKNLKIDNIAVAGLTSYIQTVSFTIPSGSTLWNFKTCDSNGNCNFATTNYTVTLDSFAPLINIKYPINTNYSINVSELNYTVTESNPDKCWYSTNGGTSNSSSVNSGINFTGVVSSEGSNTWKVWCNDTEGLLNSSSITFFKDTIYPQIQYSANSDVENTSASFSVKNSIFVNVTVNETNEVNITFSLWTLAGSYNQTSFITKVRTINWTNLPNNMYYYNVTVCDFGNNCNTTAIRKYGEKNLSIYVEGDFENKNIELASPLNISADYNDGYVYLDIIHPEYGINYSVGYLSNLLNLTINYFRKTTLSDNSYSKTYTGFYYNNTDSLYYNKSNLSILSHQYDEVVNMSINVSGSGDLEDLWIYKTNSSSVDRAYDGFLEKELIRVNTTSSGDLQNISFASAGEEVVYFYLDDSAKNNLKSAIFNVSSKKYALSFFEDFDNSTYINTSLTTLQFGKGGLMLANSSLITNVIDNFNDGIIGSIWTYYTSSYLSASESGGKLTYQANNPHPGTTTPIEGYLYPYSDKAFNLYSSDSLNFELDNYHHFEDGYYISYGYATCSIPRTRVYLGGTQIFQTHGYNAQESTNTISGMDFNLTKINETNWNVEISGIETLVYTGYDCVSYGSITETYNWTSGNYTKNYARSSCTDESGVFGSGGNVTVNPESAPLQFYVYVKSLYSDCQANIDYFSLNNLDQTIWNRTNGTLESTTIHSTAENITYATINYSVALAGPTDSILTYMSANGGSNWELVGKGVEHTFATPGTDLRYKVLLNTTDASPNYANYTAYISNLSVGIPSTTLEDVSFDFGNDGTPEYTISGNFTEANGTVQINLSTANLTDSFDSKLSGFEHLYIIPLAINSIGKGTLVFNLINITYNPNPVILNSTSIQNYLDNYGSNITNFTINLAAEQGTINVSDIRYDYAGGNNTIQVIAHNSDYSLQKIINLTYYYSRWDYKFKPANVNFVLFSPKTPTSKNVTPYGQSILIPLLNLTNYGYSSNTSTGTGYLNTPMIIFESPTPENNQSVLNGSSVNIVATITDSNSSTNTSSWIDFDRSLVGYWSMDYYNATGVFDNSSYGNFGSFNNGAGTSNLSSGWRGNALGLDGINDYVSIPYSSNLNITNEITVSACIYARSNPDNTDVIVSRGYDSSTVPYYIDFRDVGTKKKIRFGTYKAGIDIYVDSNFNITDYLNTWICVDGVFNGTAYKIYINGTLSNTTYSSVKLWTNNLRLDIGCLNISSTCQRFSNMSVDEVKIQNRALSDSEILANYNSKVNLFNASFTNLSQGQHNYTVYAVDELGLRNQTTQNFTIVTSLFDKFKKATLSVYQNGSLSCVNTTLSLTGNKSNGFLIGNYWTNLTNLTYLQTTNISLFADYDCNYSYYKTFNPQIYFRECCEDCICSEEIE